jgi:hypothetical protein
MPPRSAAAAARGCGLWQRGAGGMGASGQMSQSQFANVSPPGLASSTEKADWEEQIRAEQAGMHCSRRQVGGTRRQALTDVCKSPPEHHRQLQPIPCLPAHTVSTGQAWFQRGRAMLRRQVAAQWRPNGKPPAAASHRLLGAAAAATAAPLPPSAAASLYSVSCVLLAGVKPAAPGLPPGASMRAPSAAAQRRPERPTRPDPSGDMSGGDALPAASPPSLLLARWERERAAGGGMGGALAPLGCTTGGAT